MATAEALPGPSGFLLASQRKAVELCLWTQPLYSGLVFAGGLLWFLMLGWFGYSSITVLSYACLLHLIARLVYSCGHGVLSKLDMAAPREVPAAPEVFVTEEEVELHLRRATEVANAAFRTAYSLWVCDLEPTVFKWMGGLFALALASKIFGTTGLCFLAFVLAFTWPKLYATKKKEIDAAAFLAWTKLSELLEKAGAVVHEKMNNMKSLHKLIPKAADLKQKEKKL